MSPENQNDPNLTPPTPETTEEPMLRVTIADGGIPEIPEVEVRKLPVDEATVAVSGLRRKWSEWRLGREQKHLDKLQISAAALREGAISIHERREPRAEVRPATFIQRRNSRHSSARMHKANNRHLENLRLEMGFGKSISRPAEHAEGANLSRGDRKVHRKAAERYESNESYISRKSDVNTAVAQGQDAAGQIVSDRIRQISNRVTKHSAKLGIPTVPQVPAETPTPEPLVPEFRRPRPIEEIMTEPIDDWWPFKGDPADRRASIEVKKPTRKRGENADIDENPAELFGDTLSLEKLIALDERIHTEQTDRAHAKKDAYKITNPELVETDPVTGKEDLVKDEWESLRDKAREDVINQYITEEFGKHVDPEFRQALEVGLGIVYDLRKKGKL